MKIRWASFLPFAGVVAVAAWLRMANLANNPHWYTDEGTHLEIARHFLDGRTQYLGVDQSVLIFGRLPLFNWLLSGWISIFGRSMLTLRSLTAFCGVACVIVTYRLILQLTKQKSFALITSATLAAWQPAILYSRFGFSYNVLALFLLMAIWGAAATLQNHRKKTLWLFAGAVGFALISEFLALALLPLIGLFFITWLIQNRLNHWVDGAVAVILIGLPLGSFVAHQLLTNADAFLFDWNFTVGRVSEIPPFTQIETLQTNISMLIKRHWLVLPGLVGMVVVPSKWLRIVILGCFWGVLLIIGRTVPLFSLSFYYAIPLLPLICIGAAALAHRIIQLFHQNSVGWRVACLALALVWGNEIRVNISQVNQGFVSGIEPFLVDGDAAVEAASWVNQNATVDDLVIASPATAWLIDAYVADFQMSAASVGLETPHLPPTGLENRFVFDPHHTGADFIIIDPLWHNWAAVHVREVDEILKMEGWLEGFSAENVKVWNR